MRRFFLLLVVPFALVVVVAACEIFQISLTVDRIADVQGTQVTLRGTVTCTEPEPIILAVTIQQGTLTQSSGTQINCEGDDAWAATFGPFAQPFQPGEARVDVRAQTRPEHPEDAVQVSRKVLLLPPGS